MKKLTAILTALVMIICAAGAYAEAGPDLYDLYDATAEGKKWIGTAVPMIDGMAITSPGGLPEKVRDAMYLCYAEELDAEEIAALLGITKDAVYKRLQRGLVMMRERLGEDD